MKRLFVVTAIVIQFAALVKCDDCSENIYERYIYIGYYYNRVIQCTGAHIISPSDIHWQDKGYFQSISFYNSHIPKLSYTIIKTFGKLLSLTINGSYINSIEAEGFWLSKYLFDLHLPYNNLTILSPDTFKAQTNLSILDLSHNNIQNISKELFRNTHELMHLDLSQNALTMLEPNNFDGLTNLQHLNLSGNKISEIPHAHFGHLNNLQSLDLSHNLIISLNIQSFIGLTSLQHLNLSENRIESLPAYTFSNVHQLGTLDISKNHIEYINASELKDITRLYQINLHTNKMSCSVLSGVIQIFKAWHVTVLPGPEKKHLSIIGINCNDTQDIFTTNNTETKPINDLDMFFTKDFKNSEFYKFFSTFNTNKLTADNAETKPLEDFFTKDFKQSDFYKFFSTLNATNTSITTNRKSTEALEEFFVNDFKKSEFYKFFSTLNASHSLNTMPTTSVLEELAKELKNSEFYKAFVRYHGGEDDVKRIVNDFVGIDRHMVADQKQHLELMGKLSSLQIWLGLIIMIHLTIATTAWIYVYFNRNITGGKHKDLQLMEESESIV